MEDLVLPSGKTEYASPVEELLANGPMLFAMALYVPGYRVFSDRYPSDADYVLKSVSGIHYMCELWDYFFEGKGDYSSFVQSRLKPSVSIRIIHE